MEECWENCSGAAPDATKEDGPTKWIALATDLSSHYRERKNELIDKMPEMVLKQGRVCTLREGVADLTADFDTLPKRIECIDEYFTLNVLHRDHYLDDVKDRLKSQGVELLEQLSGIETGILVLPKAAAPSLERFATK